MQSSLSLCNDFLCVFVNTADVTLIHSSMWTSICACLSVCINKQGSSGCYPVWDSFRPLYKWIWDVSVLGLDFTASETAESLPTSISVYVCLFLLLTPPRLADYFCINHHDTGKATQFSASVGKVRGIPKWWHEAWNRQTGANLWLLV